jgi:hypothetical protein
LLFSVGPEGLLFDLVSMLPNAFRFPNAPLGDDDDDELEATDEVRLLAFSRLVT